MNPIGVFPAFPPCTVHVVQDPHVPLDHAGQRPDGTPDDRLPRVPVLMWEIDGEIHVHPDRWDLVMQMINNAKRFL